MKKLEELIKNKCSVPIESITIYKADKNINFIEVKLSFSMTIPFTTELLKDNDVDNFAKLIADEISNQYKEKMKLAGIEEMEFDIMD